MHGRAVFGCGGTLFGGDVWCEDLGEVFVFHRDPIHGVGFGVGAGYGL